MDKQQISGASSNNAVEVIGARQYELWIPVSQACRILTYINKEGNEVPLSRERVHQLVRAGLITARKVHPRLTKVKYKDVVEYKRVMRERGTTYLPTEEPIEAVRGDV